MKTLMTAITAGLIAWSIYVRVLEPVQVQLAAVLR